MRIPSFLLTEDITFESYSGYDAYGPNYGDSLTVKAHVEPSSARIVNQNGDEVISSLFLVLPHTATVSVLDKFTYGSLTYETIKVDSLKHLGKTHHIELYARVLPSA